MCDYAEHKIMLLFHKTHTHTRTHDEMLGFEVVMVVNIYTVVFMVMALCSVSLFPEDEGSRSSKMTVTIYQTTHDTESYALKVKVWFNHLNFLYAVTALHTLMLL
jgi:hypothetical protein